MDVSFFDLARNEFHLVVVLNLQFPDSTVDFKEEILNLGDHFAEIGDISLSILLDFIDFIFDLLEELEALNALL